VAGAWAHERGGGRWGHGSALNFSVVVRWRDFNGRDWLLDRVFDVRVSLAVQTHVLAVRTSQHFLHEKNSY
jgi:hypothetical protein